MSYNVLLHRQVEKYLDRLSDDEEARCRKSLKHLSEGPHRARSGADITPWKGEEEFDYRLRVGRHRFGYKIREDEVLVTGAWFK